MRFFGFASILSRAAVKPPVRFAEPRRDNLLFVAMVFVGVVGADFAADMVRAFFVGRCSSSSCVLTFSFPKASVSATGSNLRL